MKKLPIYGRGISFPFRINPVTGGIQMSDGVDDAGTVDLAYIREDWSIREDISGPQNHIAESIAHILLTRFLEHDTLPPFGSDLFNVLFEPNTPEFKMLAAHYFQEAADRWEHRCDIPQEGVEWFDTGIGIQRGELPVTVTPTFIRQQVPENLVSPFIDSRQQREAEYPVGSSDAAFHDWMSRYYGSTIYKDGATSYIRPRKFMDIPPGPDDLFYEVIQDDTWLLISWKAYKDIRAWWLIAQIAVNEYAAQEESRDFMDHTGDPIPGTLLRIPSRSRLLTQLLA